MIANKFLGAASYLHIADSCKLWRITLPICFDVTFIPFLLFSFFSFLQLKRIQNISRSITEFLSTCILSQCKPNARNMIYKCLQESVEASHQYVIVRNVWAFSASLNFRYISNCKSFSYLGTVTGSRPQFYVSTSMAPYSETSVKHHRTLDMRFMNHFGITLRFLIDIW